MRLQKVKPLQKPLIILIFFQGPSNLRNSGYTWKHLTVHILHRRDKFAPHLTSYSQYFTLFRYRQTVRDRMERIGFLQRNRLIVIIEISKQMIRINYIMTTADGLFHKVRISFPKMHNTTGRKTALHTSRIPLMVIVQLITRNFVPPHHASSFICQPIRHFISKT